MNLEQGDKVGTLAWNGYRHLEIYYATSSSGLICHTLNPRLHPDQVSYIVNHAEDKVLCVDLNILPLIEKASENFKTVEALVVMTDAKNMVKPKVKDDIKVICYEDFIKDESDEFIWPQLDEKGDISKDTDSSDSMRPPIDNNIKEELKKCLRIWNDDVDAGGFFVAVLEKNTDYVELKVDYEKINFNIISAFDVGM